MFCVAGELLVPPHAPLCSWHSLPVSVLDTRHRLQPRSGRSLGGPEHGLLWLRLPCRAPAVHGPHRPPRDRADGPARTGCWEAGERVLPAGLRRSPGRQQDSRLPAATNTSHQGKLLHDSSRVERRTEGGLSEFTALQDSNIVSEPIHIPPTVCSGDSTGCCGEPSIINVLSLHSLLLLLVHFRLQPQCILITLWVVFLFLLNTIQIWAVKQSHNSRKVRGLSSGSCFNTQVQSV